MDGQDRGYVGLVRARLFDQLDQVGTARPAIVVAPAGFGKTTLLAQYAHRHAGPVVAHHADAFDAVHGDTAVRLVEAVLTAQRRAKADGGAWPDKREAADDRAAARHAVAAAWDPGSAVTDAMSAAVERTGELLVTLDNLDQLTGTRDEQVIAHVLARRPRGVQLVLGTRRMPRLNMVRHEMAGETAIISVDDLRLRRWEVQRLLDEVYGEPLPTDGVALLTRRTGGWPAALALFHLATRGRPLTDRYRAASSSFARWSTFRQYFTETVLDGVAPEVVDLLLRTCVFETLTPERCALVSGADPQVLDDLATLHALPVTGRGDSYRYETAFRAHLEAVYAERLGTTALREAHRRAAELLVAEEAYPEAARAYARAGDWTQLQLLFAEHGRAVIEPPVAELIDLVPAHLRADEPWFVYAEAMQHLNEAQLPAALESFDRAARIFGDGRWHRSSTRQKLGVAALVADRPPTGRLHWTGWLRVAVGANGVAAVRNADLAPVEAELVRLVAAIFGGGVPIGITRDTLEARMGAGDSPVAVLALRVVRAALGVPGGAASTSVLERAADEADLLGLGWVARLALACRSLNGSTYTAADAYAIAADCRRAGDRWGFLLATAVGCIGEQRAGRLDEDRLTVLAGEARELAADAIAEWACAFVALAKARRGAPGAADLARKAVERAEAAGVPGAAVIATLALSVVDPVRRPALLREAAVRAEAAGLNPLTVRFWQATYAAVVVAQPAPKVTVRCFGGFRMEIGGRVLDLATVRPRARSALRLLAMRAGQFVHREVLIEALWSDLAPAAATRNLQVTVSALRGLLEPASGRGKAQLLVRSGDAYGLVLPPGGYADTAAFTDAVHRWKQMRRGGSFAAEVDAMRAALSAYGGDLLPEEGPADWAVDARDEFRQQATRVARELATAELTQGNVTEAIRVAEQCIALDPHDDDAWQLLLRAYARSATPAKAADARRRYSDMLAGLGVAEPTRQQIERTRDMPRHRN